MSTRPDGEAGPVDALARAVRGRGRPRDIEKRRAILGAARELLIEEDYASLRLEHVAARAGVSKGTLYRRWSSKEELAEEVLSELASPHIEIADRGDTRAEMLAAVLQPMRALLDTDFGPVIRALLSQIAVNPTIGDPFRETIVRDRRRTVAAVIGRGIARGDLRADADPDVATDLLVGSVYFRLMFGGDLTEEFAERVVDNVLHGFSAK